MIINKDEYSYIFTEAHINLLSEILSYLYTYYNIVVFDNNHIYISIIHSEKNLSYLKQVTHRIDSLQFT